MGLFSTHSLNPVHFLAQSESIGMKLSLGGVLCQSDFDEFHAATACYPGYGNTFLNSLKCNRVHAFANIDK